MAFLLASLLLTKFDNKSIWVALGKYNGQGHAWVEIIANDDNYYVLESTSGKYFTKNRHMKTLMCLKCLFFVTAVLGHEKKSKKIIQTFPHCNVDFF